MSDINLIIINEQKQTNFDRKIEYISQQHKHLDQLYPIHRQNLQNNQNQNINQEKKEEPKIVQLPSSKDLKMARHLEKMANKITNFSKPLI